jgi:hypothetical protein
MLVMVNANVLFVCGLRAVDAGGCFGCLFDGVGSVRLSFCYLGH